MAKKASNHFKTCFNPNGPVITTFQRNIIHHGNLIFKDIDGTGKLSEVNDWRLDARTRAEAYVKCLSTEEKIAQLFISDWRMGKYPPANIKRENEIILDESGTLDEAELQGKTIFGKQHLPGTSTLLKEWFARHLILRANPTAEDLADYLNQLHAVAEECEHFVPVSVASNSRNEHGEVVFGMNDAAGICISPNDVPGIDKDLYMPEKLKDKNGKAYAYLDECGNYYELNFGLSVK